MLLEVDGLVVGYGGEPALRDVTFAVAPGTSVAVLGPNGGGKTTLFRALLGELPLLGGSVRLATRVGYAPQSDVARLDFPVSALDVALMGAYARTPFWRRISRDDRELARVSLDRVGLADRADRRYGELSRGQRQRVLIARALVQDAPVLLLDEPLAGVDRPSGERIEALLGELRDEGRALLVATHDLERAATYDRVLCLNGRGVAYGPPDEALATPVLEATFGRELVILDGRAVTHGHHEHGPC